MKVKCIKTEGYTFGIRDVKNGVNMTTNYNGVDLNNNYFVYGIIIYREGIRYLLHDKFDMPNWYPAELFTVIENNIPNNWYYKFNGYTEYGITAIWGYHELVNNEEHYNGLCEQESNDVNLFLKRKMEMYNDI
jgi:hypothetical protein